MSIEIRVPDIGDFDAVDVIEVLIAEGDEVALEQSVLVLESDKASMEVPAEQAGVVTKVLVKAGDQVKKGDVIAELEVSDEQDDNEGKNQEKAEESDEKSSEQSKQSSEEKDNSSAQVEDGAGKTVDIVIPDIGDFDAVDVIEVNVSEGDSISKEQALVTLESDKASMEVPSEYEGKVVKLTVSAGDKVASGDVIGQIEVAEGGSSKSQSSENKAQSAEKAPKQSASKSEQSDNVDSKNDRAQNESAQNQRSQPAEFDEQSFAKAHASPSVRKFARELGADLGSIKGTGRKGRIVEEDVKAFVKQALSAKASSGVQGGSGIPSMPVVDFSQFGETEEQKLSRINVLTGEAMTRNWLNIPHVTQHELADVTQLEQFRKDLKAEAEKKGVRVTMLAFLMKALVVGMKELPRFNSSLSSDGKSLILKKYYNIGIAVDTPNGLVVPVIKSVDQKGIYELSSDLMEISKKAREGKLSPKDMSGGSMTISSLGGIGGHYFTPIVNAPEVAILGVSRASMQPVWNGKEFTPRLMLPLSLSYDHRVIDGADGARMIVLLSNVLQDMRRILL
ncbi:dihydrolipoyllysine-residue acetyltransferase [Rappaport israeli]|uniref:dihydrolipoyllysine-residue acetyltransferase n=1 Tax=Rappaport israeli TaxID=1839807 RepID=UPI00092FE6F0|nr:dihydrolipoyllysine-residue acetyltransferase [Rappaport israeli]